MQQYFIQIPFSDTTDYAVSLYLLTSSHPSLSGGYLNGKAKEILKRGCDAFIQKPFFMVQLSQSIREILDKR